MHTISNHDKHFQFIPDENGLKTVMLLSTFSPANFVLFKQTASTYRLY